MAIWTASVTVACDMFFTLYQNQLKDKWERDELRRLWQDHDAWVTHIWHSLASFSLHTPSTNSIHQLKSIHNKVEPQELVAHMKSISGSSDITCPNRAPRRLPRVTSKHPATVHCIPFCIQMLHMHTLYCTVKKPCNF